MSGRMRINMRRGIRLLIVVVILCLTLGNAWRLSSVKKGVIRRRFEAVAEKGIKNARSVSRVPPIFASTADIKVEESASKKAIGSSNALKYARISESGAALEIKEVNLSIGNNDIISSIDWTIMPNERWALVGQNGAGKSTLLKALTGTGGDSVMVRDGFIAMAKKSRIGYLEQKGVSGSVNTVRTEVSSRMDRLQAATIELEAAEQAVTGGDYSEEALLRLERASTEFDAAGGYTVDQKIGNVLKGLGFKEEDYERKCSEFSGGWQMRIALARLLLSEPDLLILDEPTNHLDRGAREWLGDYLSRYDGTLLVVSHDLNLLRTAVNSIAEVRHGKIELYKSRTYDQWQVEREERVKAAQALYEANQREIARLQTFVDRFGAKTMGASLAQSKLKTIEKLEEAAPEAPVVTDGYKPSLHLPRPPRGTKLQLELKNVELSWLDKVILRDISLTIERGMRIVVRGPNGAGKSTLLSALSGKLPPSKGQRIEGEGLELGVFTQDLAQDLDQEATAVEVVTRHVRQKDPTLPDEKARSVLGALGLIQSKALRKVGMLSGQSVTYRDDEYHEGIADDTCCLCKSLGGEKARVALASFVLIPHTMLLLDEPSNHLDVETLSVLTKALREFEGTVLVISHDRKFLEELEPTHVITVRGGLVNMEERGLREGDWNDPLDSREDSSDKFAKPSSSSSTNSASGKNDKANPAPVAKSSTSSQPAPVDKKKAMNAQKTMKKLEASIEKLNSEIAVIDNEMMQNGRNVGKLTELQKCKDELTKKLEKLYAEFDDLLQYVN